MSINGNEGNDTIYGSYYNTILGGDGSDVIYASSYSTINGGADNDTIYNGDYEYKGGESLKMDGGLGDDSIFNYGGSNVTINGGKDNDDISNHSSNVTINAGKGKDSISNYGSKVKINGGAGKDIFIYKPGEGTDKIYDYTAGDMLKILKTNGKEGGSFTKAKFSSGDLTLTIKGGGTVIFDGVSKNDKFNINGKSYSIKGTTLK